MSYSPKPLTELGAYWTSKGGVNLGIVGDVMHVTGYHLGRDRIYGPQGKGGEDYSVQHPRDKAGLTNAAAAIDLGKLDGTYTGLQDFSRWLVARCQASAPGTEDIREVIYSPDGSRVQRWSGIDGNIHTGAGNGDVSHTRHSHISWFRDSESRDKIGVFSPYWEDDMLTWWPTPLERWPRSKAISSNRKVWSRSMAAYPASCSASGRDEATAPTTMIGERVSGSSGPRPTRPDPGHRLGRRIR